MIQSQWSWARQIWSSWRDSEIPVFLFCEEWVQAAVMSGYNWIYWAPVLYIKPEITKREKKGITNTETEVSVEQGGWESGGSTWRLISSTGVTPPALIRLLGSGWRVIPRPSRGESCYVRRVLIVVTGLFSFTARLPRSRTFYRYQFHHFFLIWREKV